MFVLLFFVCLFVVGYFVCLVLSVSPQMCARSGGKQRAYVTEYLNHVPAEIQITTDGKQE